MTKIISKRILIGDCWRKKIREEFKIIGPQQGLGNVEKDVTCRSSLRIEEQRRVTNKVPTVADPVELTPSNNWYIKYILGNVSGNFQKWQKISLSGSPWPKKYPDFRLLSGRKFPGKNCYLRSGLSVPFMNITGESFCVNELSLRTIPDIFLKFNHELWTTSRLKNQRKCVWLAQGKSLNSLTSWPAILEKMRAVRLLD